MARRLRWHRRLVLHLVEDLEHPEGNLLLFGGLAVSFSRGPTPTPERYQAKHLSKSLRCRASLSTEQGDL
jgi:hypothetical protein